MIVYSAQLSTVTTSGFTAAVDLCLINTSHLLKSTPTLVKIKNKKITFNVYKTKALLFGIL